MSGFRFSSSSGHLEVPCSSPKPVWDPALQRRLREDTVGGADDSPAAWGNGGENGPPADVTVPGPSLPCQVRKLCRKQFFPRALGHKVAEMQQVRQGLGVSPGRASEVQSSVNPSRKKGKKRSRRKGKG